MAQTVSSRNARPNLGPGFWPVTALIAVASIATVYFTVTSDWPIGLVPAGEPARSVDDLFRFCGAVGGVLFNIVTIYTIYFMIVFKRPKNAPPSAIGVQIHDAPVLEFWWTVIPTILVVVLAIASVKIWGDLQNQQGDVMTLEAIGYQFGFQMRYPKLANPVSGEIHVPVNTPLTIHTTSRDVIHSFWVPELRIKADMVPGLINTLRVTPTVPGTYRIICTEFCGIAHGAMKATFVVDTQQAFAKWFAAQGGSGTAASGGAGAAAGGSGGGAEGAAVAITSGKADEGQKLFGQKCSACHSVGPYDQKLVGPGLGKIFSDPAHPKLVDGDDATPQNVAKILHNGYSPKEGGPAMPSASMNAINNVDIANLTAYLVSLSGKK